MNLIMDIMKNKDTPLKGSKQEGVLERNSGY